MTNLAMPIMTHIVGHPNEKINRICKQYYKELRDAVSIFSTSRMLAEAIVAMHQDCDTWLDGFWCDEVEHIIAKVYKRNVHDLETFKHFAQNVTEKKDWDVLAECFKLFNDCSVEKAMAYNDICIDYYMPKWGTVHPITRAVDKKLKAMEAYCPKGGSMDGAIIGGFFSLWSDIFSVYFIGDLEHRGSRIYFETQSSRCGKCSNCVCDNAGDDWEHRKDPCPTCPHVEPEYDYLVPCQKCGCNFDGIDECDLNYCPKCGTPAARPITNTQTTSVCTNRGDPQNFVFLRIFCNFLKVF